jgi:hypothetical protein
MVSEAVRAGPASGLAVATRHDAGCLVVELETDQKPANALDIEDRIRAVDGRVLVMERPDGRVRLQAEIPCGS